MCKVILLYSRKVNAMSGKKDLNYGAFLAVYGGLLTEKQREIMEQYYWEDLSLGEIAENFDITRQAVRDGIKRSEKRLAKFDEQLGIMDKANESGELFEKIAELLNEMTGLDSHDLKIAQKIAVLAKDGIEIF